jgi:spermidine synthase
MTSLALTERNERTRAFAGAGAYALAVFCAAALVFTVEPLVGKLTLPVLGGSPAVWNTSLAFFQLGLLGGYGYAHLLQKLVSIRKQAALHLAVLVLTGLSLPLKLSGALGDPNDFHPALWLAGTLLVTLGAPFAALCATAPLLQAWFARAHGEKAASAYGLYAASNLGSLLALAAYPTLIEPMIGLTRQAELWSWAYVGFLVLIAALAAGLWRAPPAPLALPADAQPISWRLRWRWIALSAAPASLLSGVTAHITADIASVPFLWVVPLELYLLSFILAFGAKTEGVRPWALTLQLVSTPLALLALAKADLPWPEQLTLQLAAFFGAAMVCAQALAACKPPPARLTEFYAWMALGGALGGGFNAFLAPVIFPEVWEYPAALVLAMLARPSTGRPLEPRERVWMGAGLFWIAPLMIPSLTVPDLLAAAMRLTPAAIAVMLRRRSRAVCILLAALAASAETQSWGRYTDHYRSFFGVTHLHEVETRAAGKLNVMVHGTTLHGAQYRDPARRCTPTSYYSPATLIGQVYATEHKRAPEGLSMATVGLGVGTVATFVRPVDRMTLFEIDPLVAKVATDPAKFSFVKGCAQGPTNIVIGDARLSLQKVANGSYDLMLIDAFSSDSVPTHLLTAEALSLYLDKLKPDGVLLLHLSNRNLDLIKPTAATVKAVGAYAREGWHWVLPQTSPYTETSGAAMLVARNIDTLDRYKDLSEWELTQPKGRPWTDDRTNVWGAMLAHIRWSLTS